MNTTLYIELLEKEVMELRHKAARRLTMDKIPFDATKIHTREGAVTASNIMNETNESLNKLSEHSNA